MRRVLKGVAYWICEFCGTSMSVGARSCRDCWQKGKGAKRGGPTGTRLGTVLRRARARRCA